MLVELSHCMESLEEGLSQPHPVSSYASVIKIVNDIANVKNHELESL